VVDDASGGGAAHRLLVEPGDRVTATGRFVALPDGEWLDLAKINDFVGHHRPWKSDRSVRLEGLDAASIPVYEGPDQVVMPGVVRVTGVWHGDVITVEAQSTVPWLTHTDEPLFDLPAPAGGWDTAAQSRDMGGLAELRASGQIVYDSWLRDESGALLLRVAASDVEAVERVLAPQLARRLCVVKSRYTAAHLREVREMFDARHVEWGFESWTSEGMTAQCQPYAEVVLTRITADLAAWADTLPDGLLNLYPILKPA
jgi:hypothetical protein